MNPSDDEPRKRAARACDSCYKRKVRCSCTDELCIRLTCQIKCDAAVPQCNWCSHHDLPCTFDRVIQRKRKTQDEGRSVPFILRFPFVSQLLTLERSRPKVSRLSERISRIEQLLADNLMGGPSCGMI